MKRLKYNTIIKKDGEIKLTGVPCEKGQRVEMIIMIESKNKNSKNILDLLPQHKLHTGNNRLNRDTIYDDAR